MSESKFLAQLNLSPDERLHPPGAIGRLKTISEWASAAIEAVKDNTDFLSAIKALSPWAEAAFSAAKDSLGPVKFVVKLFEELTKIQDPEELARLACTIAYQAAAEEAVAKAGLPVNPTITGPKFDDSVDDVDFSDFIVNHVVTHRFVVRADRILQHYLPQGGYSSEQVDQIIAQIHDTLPARLNALLSHGKSKEKFDPLFRWLELPADGRLSRAALRRHSEYVSWVFTSAPVLQCEPYALAHICIDAECSKLTFGELRKPPDPQRPRPNPFEEGDKNGGRHPLLETVMGYIGDPKFRDAIVIQGSAGCGKSTFTLRLSDHLRREGLRPIRIRLRDVVLGREFYSQLGEALSYEDDAYLPGHDRFIPGSDPLRGGAIFHEELRYGKSHVTLCPYVLILDGWDEISVAVSEGFKQRVKELLLRIRSELFRRDRPIVRVILTGRPSDAVDECTEFFRDETPILTVRILNPAQLPLYAEKLRAATEARPLSFEGVSNWKFPDDEDLKPVFAQYDKEFRDKRENSARFIEERDAKTGVAAVLGYPLLLHFTFRLLAEANANRKDLLESPTTLLRMLTDYATEGADLPSDRQQGTKIQSRLSGSDLRVLLRRTAAQMTTLGQESIAKNELEKRLRTTDLVGQVKDVSKDKIVSALLVSFYFKGGNTALGCEFTHKAFREYLFAEEIVETLKGLARTMREDLPERPPSLYWRDYDEADPRRRASFELASLLAPQWLSPEVVNHLGSLLEWEIRRAFSHPEGSAVAGATSPSTPEEWRRTRTFLADLWDWWADGVHLRPQPREHEDTGQIKWDTSIAERLIPKCRPLVRDTTDALPEPVRTTTLDAHLGDAAFRFASWVHSLLQKESHGESFTQARRCQGIYRQQLMFRPTGTNPEHFGILCSRISAAGWRPNGLFPRNVSARGIDFRGTIIRHLAFDYSDLAGSAFDNALMEGSSFIRSSLIRCNFLKSTIIESRFIYATLDSSDFALSTLVANRFNGASLGGVSFERVNWGLAASWSDPIGSHAMAPCNDLESAVGVDESIRELAKGNAAKEEGRPHGKTARGHL